MKHIFTIILLLFLIGNSYANEQLLRFEFEEGEGLLTFDSSGNNYAGILSQTSWTNIEKFGTYALSFDGISQMLVDTGSTMPPQISVGFWLKCDNDGNSQNIYSIYDSNSHNYFSLGYDVDGGDDFTLYFEDDLNVEHFYHLDTSNKCSETGYKHYLSTYDNSTEEYKFYVDGLLTDTIDLSLNPIKYDSNIKYLKLGVQIDGLDNFLEGDLDEFGIYNFILNGSQILELQTNPLISGLNNTYGGNGDNNDTNITLPYQLLDIINSTSPIGTTANLVQFEVLLNYESTCDLYIDNNKVETFEDVLAFTYEKLYTTQDEHTYFVYCEYRTPTTIYTDLSEIITFETILDDKTIDFNLFDPNDNLLLGENLYLVTPCFDEFGFFNNLVGDMAQNLNKDGIHYIQNLKNGNANFNLSYTNNYEFCLVRGQINYLEDTFTNDFNIVEFGKQIDLGDLYVNNETLVFNFRVDNQDINNVYEPSFWGKTVESLFNIVFFTLIGGLIIFLGVRSNSEKLMVAGAIVIMAGAGVSIGTFFGFL